MDQYKTLYLSGFSANVTTHDIHGLLSKVSTVYDIYIPPATATGIVRNFAMIKVENKENLAKFVSSLNHSLWKGCKIRLEFAKEHYLDKLKREHEEMTSHIDSDGENQDIESNIAPIEFKPPLFTDTKLYLAVSKMYQKFVTVSTEPVVGPVSKRNESKSRVLRCRKIVFDDSGLPVHRPTKDTYLEDTNDSNMETSANCQSTSKTSTSVPTSAPTPSATEYRGGGVRKGFGTLASLPVSRPSASANNTAAAEHVDATLPELRVPDAEMDEDDTPCISAEDLAAEALDRERRRYASLLSQVLSKPSTAPVGTNPVSKAQSAPPVVEPAVEPGGSYVNLNALKQIYHKEGGVWWGSDEKPTGAVGRGDEAEDEVFREAEKLGIDIRPSSLFTGAQATTGESGSGEAGETIGGGMLFGFFDSTVSDVNPDTQGAAKSSTVLLSEGDNIPDIAASMDWTHIAAKALKFSRTESEAEVIDAWRQAREKLAIEYKRKRREARKREDQRNAHALRSADRRGAVSAERNQSDHPDSGGKYSPRGKNGKGFHPPNKKTRR